MELYIELLSKEFSKCHHNFSTRARTKSKGGELLVTTSKQRKRRELKKKDLMSIEGRGTPSDLSKQCHVDEIGSMNPHLNLNPIEEEGEDSGSRAPSMAESEHPRGDHWAKIVEQRAIKN